MTPKTIPLTLPEEVWGRLASRAAREGRPVADLVADAVASLVPELTEKPDYPDGYTGEPGNRLAVLDAAVKAAYGSGRVRSSVLKKSLRVTS